MEFFSAQAMNQSSFKTSPDSRQKILIHLLKTLIMGGSLPRGKLCLYAGQCSFVARVFSGDVSTFKQLYLIGKILGESLSLKLITSKCLFRWELSDEATIIDMGDDFTWLSFPML